MNNHIDPYKDLKAKLEETTNFPTKYMFKFIIPSNDDKVKAIENIFNYIGAVIKSKKSKTGKFISFTILVKMNSADAIIEKYKEVSKIEGVISL
ncbi:MAG TPA: DUF493 domain-containing protein [Flavobacteriaceae bacterium]|jgi:putative lipoic acid-binding regulatory protein|nr:DUF493 domain-containing protein [Flavobacteriaceae bacterium]HBS12850.1 DUF493 domain-containing protein [Flavobacteriaceae bacterium]